MKTTDKIKRQPTKWEKIFAIDRTKKGLISKYRNSSYNSIEKKKMSRRPEKLVF